MTTNDQNAWPPPGVDWYYSDESTAIACGDCRLILPHLPKVDLVLTDPPYGLGNKLTGGNWGKRVGEAASWDVRFDSIQLLLEKADHSIIWGGNYYELPPTRCWLGWIKRDAVPTVSSLELAWTSFDANSKFCDCTIAQTNPERNGHPTLKPYKLMRWCLSFTDAQTILDPFMGSGTTLRAAKDLGRKAIGIEIELKYVEIAIKRLQQEVLPLELKPIEKRERDVQPSMLTGMAPITDGE